MHTAVPCDALYAPGGPQLCESYVRCIQSSCCQFGAQTAVGLEYDYGALLVQFFLSFSLHTYATSQTLF
jgi:hypothetical protein